MTRGSRLTAKEKQTIALIKKRKDTTMEEETRDRSEQISAEWLQRVREQNRDSQRRRRQRLNPQPAVQQRQTSTQNFTTDQVPTNRTEQPTPPTHDQHRLRWRNRARERRAALTNDQRQQQLARRRSNYNRRQHPGGYTLNFLNNVPRRVRSSRHRPPSGLNTTGMTSRRRQTHATQDPQNTRLPVIPEEGTLNVFHETTPRPNEARVRHRTHLTPLSHFTPNYATYEQGSSSGSTTDRRDEQSFQNFGEGMSHRKIVFQLWENCQHENGMTDEETDVQRVPASQQIVRIGIYCSKWKFSVRANTIDLRNLIEEYLGIRSWQNRWRQPR